MEERTIDEEESAGPTDGLLEVGTETGEEADGRAGWEKGRPGTIGVKSNIWTVLSATSTLLGRRFLSGFPYPICFLVLLQLIAYCFVVNTILIVRLKEIRSPKRKCVPGVKHSRYEKFVLALRFCVTSFLSTTATICGAEALLRYINLPVLVALPIFTYVIDSVLSRLAHYSWLARLDQKPTLRGLWAVGFVLTCTCLIVYEDYRLNPIALLFALAGFSLFSISKVIPRIGRRIESGAVHTWDCPLYMYLWGAIPPFIITSCAAFMFEDIGSAFHVIRSWGGWALLINLAPGGLHHVLFNCSMDTAYPFSSTDGAAGALEDSSSEAKAAIASTLQAGFLVFCIGVIGGEQNFVDWVQVLAYTLLYVVAVGPKHIGFYPPRLLNLVARILRKPQLKVTNQLWQLPVSLCITTTVFISILSSGMLYWTDKVAFERGLAKWTGPTEALLDLAYVPPQSPIMEMVIAHSDGDPVQSISDLINEFMDVRLIRDFNPRIKIYTKDTSISSDELNAVTASFSSRVISGTMLPNSGGVAATFIHHMLDSWDDLSSQTIYLSTSSSPTQRSRATSRVWDYFIPTIPLHSTRHSEQVTSFLNLGEYGSCHCDNCVDQDGWTDSFHLIKSMWGAARPGAAACGPVVLTHGNSFIASADSIRGLPKDVWQTLYDGLTNDDMRNAWAHNADSLPKGKGKGKMVFGDEDSLEKPYLGYTIERLWGILLQCSTAEVAWRCPNTLRGWRRQGRKTDCGCLHW